MHGNMAIIIVTLVVLGYGYYSKYLSHLNISGPMIFTTIGILLSPVGFSLVDVNLDTHMVTITAEIALISPPIPAAAFVCPTIDLNEVTPHFLNNSFFVDC